MYFAFCKLLHTVHNALFIYVFGTIQRNPWSPPHRSYVRYDMLICPYSYILHWEASQYVHPTGGNNVTVSLWFYWRTYWSIC